MREASMSLLLASAMASACCKVSCASPKTPMRAGRRKVRTGGSNVVASWRGACAGAVCAEAQGSDSGRKR